MHLSTLFRCKLTILAQVLLQRTGERGMGGDQRPASDCSEKRILILYCSHRGPALSAPEAVLLVSGRVAVPSLFMSHML